MNNQRYKDALILVSATIFGAFISRWVDKVLDFSFPWDILSIILISIFWIFVLYCFFMWLDKIFLKSKKN